MADLRQLFQPSDRLPLKELMEVEADANTLINSARDMLDGKSMEYIVRVIQYADVKATIAVMAKEERLTEGSIDEQAFQALVRRYAYNLLSELSVRFRDSVTNDLKQWLNQ